MKSLIALFLLCAAFNKAQAQVVVPVSVSTLTATAVACARTLSASEQTALLAWWTASRSMPRVCKLMNPSAATTCFMSVAQPFFTAHGDDLECQIQFDAQSHNVGTLGWTIEGQGDPLTGGFLVIAEF